MLGKILKYCGVVCIVYSVIAFFGVSMLLAELGTTFFQVMRSLMLESFLFFVLGIFLFAVRKWLAVASVQKLE